MSENCSDCKDSILSNQKATLPEPQCQGDCPEINCNGIGTYTDCVILNDTYSCIVPSGSTLSEALEEINTKLCAATNDGCGVQVTADDTCCGFLGNPSGATDSQGNKIRSESLAINIEGPSGTCQYLSIEEKDWTWVSLASKISVNWESDGVDPAYGYRNNTITGKGEIRFRGHIKRKNTSTVSIPLVFTGTLPSNIRPTEDKKYYFFSVSDTGKPYFVEINISASDGKIQSYFTNVSPNTGTTGAKGVKISLDSINYII